MSDIKDFNFDAPDKFEQGDGVQKRLRFEGLTRARITDLIPGKAASSGNYTIKVIAEGLDGAMDDDYPGTGASMGIVLKSGAIPVTGTVGSGRNKGKKNVDRFFSFVHSAHTYLHEDADAAQAETDDLCGQKLNFQKMKDFLVGKEVAAIVRNRSFVNQEGETIYYTEMGDAIPAGRYDSALKSKTLRRLWADPSKAPTPTAPASQAPQASEPEAETEGVVW